MLLVAPYVGVNSPRCGWGSIFCHPQLPALLFSLRGTWLPFAGTFCLDYLLSFDQGDNSPV